MMKKITYGLLLCSGLIHGSESRYKVTPEEIKADFEKIYKRPDNDTSVPSRKITLEEMTLIHAATDRHIEECKKRDEEDYAASCFASKLLRTKALLIQKIEKHDQIQPRDDKQQKRLDLHLQRLTAALDDNKFIISHRFNSEV